VEALTSGNGELVLLSGDVGVGKTALMRHVAAGSRESGATVLEANATELDGLLGPLLEACRRALASGVELTLGAEARTAIELDRSRSGPTPVLSMEQMGWALERFLVALSERSSVVLMVDNVHVARSEEVVILRELARALHEQRVLLLVSCVTAGTETSASATRGLAGFRELAALEGVVHLTLEPLAPEALLQILYDRNEGVRLESEVARRVVDTAEGNPLLALELLRHLKDTGQVLLEGSTVRSSGEWGGDSLPQRVYDVVARRLEGLDDDARSLIDAAAVDGRVFDGAAVQSVVGHPLLKVLRGLQRLYRERRLVEPDGDAFRFGSRVIHDVIYAQVAPALRKALHESFAVYYEQPGVRIDDERLAVHWERAGDTERARPYLVRAAHDARARQDDVHAVALFARAGLAADPLPEDWIRDDPRSVLALCCALDRLDESDTARALAAALAELAEDPAVRDAAGVQHALTVFYASGPAAVDLELLARVGEQSDVSLARGDALYLQGVIAKHRGELDRARSLLERAEQDYKAAQLSLERVAAIQQLASVALRSHAFDDAERMFDEAAALARESGRRSSATINEVNATLARIERGELDGAEARLTRAEHQFQLLATPGQAAHVALLLAQLHCSTGDLSLAANGVERARQQIGERGHLLVAVDIRVRAAQIACLRGQLADAQGAIGEAEGLAKQSGSQSDEDRSALLRLQVLLCLGERDRACEQARAMASSTAAMLWEEITDLVPLRLPLAALPGLDEPNHAVWAEALRSLASGSPNPAALQPLLIELSERPNPWQLAASKQVCRVLKYAMERRGDESGLEQARSGMRAAEQMGHVWWEAYWLRILARDTADAFYEERLDELIVRIARALPDATAQRKLMVAWAPSS